MHELGIAEGVLDAVQRRAAGRRVTALTVRVGALQRVDQASMETAFALVSAGSVAEGARVRLVVVPVRVHCRGCGSDVESDDPLAVCAGCGGADLDLSGGDELLLESLQMAREEMARDDDKVEMVEVSGRVPRYPR
ncbi:MAG: hydrogenase maturation nickel metallochaperone HypA [Actinomycetes bacterium]